MKLMLTSFGIDQRSKAPHASSVFDNMPPVSFRSFTNKFIPDYSLLILCDQIVMDGSSFEQLVRSPAHVYSGVAETFQALKADNRIQLVDFSSVLRKNSSLLDKMMERDMSAFEQWVVPLRESRATWRHFVENMRNWPDGDKRRKDQPEEFRLFDPGGVIGHLLDGMNQRYVLAVHCAHAPYRTMHHVPSLDLDYTPPVAPDLLLEEALSSSAKRRRKKYRGVLREAIRGYLSYVNANLLLASELELPFHDWLDFTPFYSRKFLSVAKREDETEQGRKQVERLFTLAFPELAIKDTKSLLTVLNDKRIRDLRSLISDAVAGKVQIDEHFAKSTLADVLRTERRVTRFRNVVGYLTLPIGFLPTFGTPVQKLVEEAVSAPVAKKMRRMHRWFYMLSELSTTDDKSVHVENEHLPQSP